MRPLLKSDVIRLGVSCDRSSDKSIPPPPPSNDLSDDDTNDEGDKEEAGLDIGVSTADVGTASSSLRSSLVMACAKASTAAGGLLPSALTAIMGFCELNRLVKSFSLGLAWPLLIRAWRTLGGGGAFLVLFSGRLSIMNGAEGLTFFRRLLKVLAPGSAESSSAAAAVSILGAVVC